MLHILNKENTLLNKFVAQLRSVDIQTDSMRFRKNLERSGEIMAYEISKQLNYSKTVVETPLGEAIIDMPDSDIVIATILRAGIPFHQGFLNYFDDAQSAFITAYRRYSKDGSFNVHVEHVSSCDIEGKTLILVDPMLATGVSLVLTYEALIERAGKPKHTHVATVVASEEGVEHVRKSLPKRNSSIWCAAVDEELTVKSYIVPGIGDVGDLAFGEKMDDK